MKDVFSAAVHMLSVTVAEGMLFSEKLVIFLLLPRKSGESSTTGDGRRASNGGPGRTPCSAVGEYVSGNKTIT